jgi:excisionase family DNA binding protein
MAKGKNVLTTGDVAKICNVAPRTVSKWFDSGQLKGYRIPGSRDRRIPLNELIRFMKQNNMPTTALPISRIRVLIVDGRTNTMSTLAEDMRNRANYDVQTVASSFETGVIVQKFAPHVMLINLLAGDVDAAGICKSVRCDEDLQTIKIIAVVNRSGESESAALLQLGFDGYVSFPCDAAEIVKKIEETIAIIY